MSSGSCWLPVLRQQHGPPPALGVGVPSLSPLPTIACAQDALLSPGGVRSGPSLGMASCIPHLATPYTSQDQQWCPLFQGACPGLVRLHTSGLFTAPVHPCIQAWTPYRSLFPCGADALPDTGCTVHPMPASSASVRPKPSRRQNTGWDYTASAHPAGETRQLLHQGSAGCKLSCKYNSGVGRWGAGHGEGRDIGRRDMHPRSDPGEPGSQSRAGRG